MTATQRTALKILDAANANAIYCEGNGWIWRDEVRQSESLAEKVCVQFRSK